MATINDETLRHRQRTQFYAKQAGGGLVRLPFELVTIDHGFQAYELTPMTLDENFEERVGTLTPPVILDRNVGLPFPVPNSPDQHAVFEYHGI